MNPFTSIAPSLRRKFYVTYGFVALGVSSVATYCAAVQIDVPTWDVGIGAVLVPIGALLGATAASNVSEPPPGD